MRQIIKLTFLTILLSSLVACRSRVQKDYQFLHAKEYVKVDEDVVYLYKLIGSRVTMNICLGKEWSDGDCAAREMAMPYKILRKHLVDEIKRTAKDAEFKQRYHRKRVDALKRSDSDPAKDKITLSFHLSELDYYKKKRELTKWELERMLELDENLEKGLVYVLNKKASEKFLGEPLAEKLRTIFFREGFQFKDDDLLTWRFLGNDMVFYGAEKMCERYFPGYRLPNSKEASHSVLKGLGTTSFKFAVKQHYPRYTGTRTFWTRDLPEDTELQGQFDQIRHKSKRAWAHNIEVSDVKGQMLLMNFRSSLFCVK